ncbi:MAG: four helix bundle protein [Deltaproteobacteria bacterium]|nr:four helix bundle protein [Deltaproteobacteria bacterium]
MKESIVKDKSYSFALRIICTVRLLRKQREYEFARQLFRSGTGIGANVEEALAGISRRDFAAKRGIASKEACETHYWLRLLRDSQILATDQIASMVMAAEELLRILTAIVKTTQTDRSKLTPQTNKSELEPQKSKLKTKD